MKKYLYELNDEEKNIRANWKRFTIVLYVFYPIIHCLGMFLLEGNQAAFFWISIFWGLFGFVIIWYFAYEKYGTVLLGMILALSPIQVVRSIFQELTGFFSPWMIALSVIDLFLFIQWYRLSLKLRRINKKMQLYNLKWPEFWESLEKLKGANSLEDLDEQFSALIRAWPQFEVVCSDEYDDRKLELSNMETV